MSHLTKTCFKCKEEKLLEFFHKHKKTKDGHLNKCSSCSLKDLYEWRLNNPDYRKKEHEKIRQKENRLTRQEYLLKLKTNSKGRKVTSLWYQHKRRTQFSNFIYSELDEFVFKEACILRDIRNKTTNITWHIDHIVPINYDKACGLHNAFNLQVVPSVWNCKKSNRNTETFFPHSKSVAGY
jgi:hypothetical protein